MGFTVRSAVGDGECGRGGGNGYWWYRGEDEHDRRGTTAVSIQLLLKLVNKQITGVPNI